MPELADYSLAIQLRSLRAPSLTPKNMGDDAFELIAERLATTVT